MPTRAHTQNLGEAMQFRTGRGSMDHFFLWAGLWNVPSKWEGVFLGVIDMLKVQLETQRHKPDTIYL